MMKTITVVGLVAFFVMNATSLNSKANEEQPPVFKLNQGGVRGLVQFNHRTHETKISPDPDYPYRAKPGAACEGCHHTTNNVGVIQLVKCASCHFEPANTKNPKDKEMNEISTDEAFHRNCIGCHRASQKGPRLCTGCHLD